MRASPSQTQRIRTPSGANNGKLWLATPIALEGVFCVRNGPAPIRWMNDASWNAMSRRTNPRAMRILPLFNSVGDLRMPHSATFPRPRTTKIRAPKCPAKVDRLRPIGQLFPVFLGWSGPYGGKNSPPPQSFSTSDPAMRHWEMPTRPESTHGAPDEKRLCAGCCCLPRLLPHCSL